LFCVIFGIFWLFCCLIWCIGKGKNLVQTWLDFAWFLLFIGSGIAWFCLMLCCCIACLCYCSLLLSYCLTCCGIVSLILVLTVVGTLTKTPRQYIFIQDNEKANGWGSGVKLTFDLPWLSLSLSIVLLLYGMLL
jgi:hypothetical protein